MCPHFQASWLSMLLFTLTGTLLGSLGGGGSLLALPIFLLVLHIPHELAVPATAAVVGFAALSGAWDAWRHKQLDLKILLRFALPAMVMAAAGSFATRWIPAPIQQSAFVVILLYASTRLLRRQPVATATLPPNPTRLAAAGAGSGLLMGLFGVGGGFIATPALVLKGGLSVAAAIPVTLGTIALGAASSLAIQIPSGTFRWTIVLPALLATLLGMEIGRSLSSRIPSAWLLRGFGVLLLAFATWMFVGLFQ